MQTQETQKTNGQSFFTTSQVGAVTQKEINAEYQIMTNISLALTILGLLMVAILHYRKRICYKIVQRMHVL